MPEAKIRGCSIANGCHIEGNVENCVIGRNVIIKRGAVVKNSVILPGAYIGEGAKLDHVLSLIHICCASRPAARRSRSPC